MSTPESSPEHSLTEPALAADVSGERANVLVRRVHAAARAGPSTAPPTRKFCLRWPRSRTDQSRGTGAAEETREVTRSRWSVPVRGLLALTLVGAVLSTLVTPAGAVGEPPLQRTPCPTRRRWMLCAVSAPPRRRSLPTRCRPMIRAACTPSSRSGVRRHPQRRQGRAPAPCSRCRSPARPACPADGRRGGRGHAHRHRAGGARVHDGVAVRRRPDRTCRT